MIAALASALAGVWWNVVGLGAQATAPPARTPEVLWHRDERGWGQPALDGETVYFLTHDHHVLAVAAASGRTIWQQPTGEPGASTLGSSLVVAGRMVVAGDYNLVAFDRGTGQPRWRFAPVVGHAPGIFLGGEAGGLIFAGSGAGRLHAVRTSTGEGVWSVAVAPSSAATVFAPATDGVTVFAGYTVFGSPATGGVVAVEARTGRLLWRTPFAPAADPGLGTGVAGGPLLVDDVVVVTRGDGDIHGLDRRTGRLRWTLPSIDVLPPVVRPPGGIDDPATSPDVRPLVRSGSLLIAGSLKGHVIAWDLRSQEERWRFFDRSLGSVVSGLSADADSVYVPFGAGRQVALWATTGRERWRTESGVSYFWPAVSDGRRLFMGGRGGLHAVRH